MNPYDEEQTTRRHGWDEDYGRRDEPPRAAGRASVGRASVPGGGYPPPGGTRGRHGGDAYGSSDAYGASSADPYGSPDSYGSSRDSYGSSRDSYASSRDSYGSSRDAYGSSRDSYGSSYGPSPEPYGAAPDPYGSDRDPYLRGGGPGYGEPPPRPVSPTAGRASARPGRTPVRPVGGARNGGIGPLRPGSPGGPTGPGGPGGPVGPGGRGPRGPYGDDDPGPEPSGGGWLSRLGLDRLGFTFGRGRGYRKRNGGKSRKARWRNIVIASVAVFIMLTGGGFIGVTYYVGTVEPGDELQFPATTTLYYADEVTEMAKLGEKTRYPLSFDEMNDWVIEAIIAAEDDEFWTHPGVDFVGVLSAAWNNFTGGQTRGASTLTQQYARLAYQLSGQSYNRKIKEAILAWKMDDQFTKEQVLEKYLNAVPLGRGANGIEAAAKAYFNKTVRRDAPPEQQVNLAEAMALAGMAKQPYVDPNDPLGAPGFDPYATHPETGEELPTAKESAIGRWEYVRSRMLVLIQSAPQPPGGRQLVYPTAEELNAQTFPMESFKPHTPDLRLTQPVGLVRNHVLSELTYNNPNSPFNGWKWKDIEDGGFKIITTIDKRAQDAAVRAADQADSGSPLAKQPENLQAALVAVEPGTGRVLAYYGGHEGHKADFAGIFYNENGEAEGYGRFPPGSSMKVYTLAAALKAGVSLESWWNWEPHPLPGRAEGNLVTNASQCYDYDRKDPLYYTPCTLLDSTTKSLNVPFYEITTVIGNANVLQLARDAGINHIWNDNNERIDLVGADPADVVRNRGIGFEVGIGQYPITVMDHANGMATMANGGHRAQAHFVIKVLKGDELKYSEKLETISIGLTQAQSDDLNYALSKVGTANLNIGWATAGKTGTWECRNREKCRIGSDNSHAWMVGYTKKIGVAVWVGLDAGQEGGPIRDSGNRPIYGSGVPAQIWRQFVTDATKAINWPKQNTQWSGYRGVGQGYPKFGVPSPTPPVPTDDPFCPWPGHPLCDTIEPTPPVEPTRTGNPGPGPGHGRNE